jgi:hypothetical protein
VNRFKQRLLQMSVLSGSTSAWLAELSVIRKAARSFAVVNLGEFSCDRVATVRPRPAGANHHQPQPQLS